MTVPGHLAHAMHFFITSSVRIIFFPHNYYGYGLASKTFRSLLMPKLHRDEPTVYDCMFSAVYLKY